jgi:hypothetical protein
MNWKELVKWAGQSAEKVHAFVLVRVTDCIDLDDTYHVEIDGYRLRARTQQGVDCLLQEFTVPDGGFRVVCVEVQG